MFESSPVDAFSGVAIARVARPTLDCLRSLQTRSCLLVFLLLVHGPNRCRRLLTALKRRGNRPSRTARRMSSKLTVPPRDDRRRRRSEGSVQHAISGIRGRPSLRWHNTHSDWVATHINLLPPPWTFVCVCLRLNVGKSNRLPNTLLCANAMVID